MTFKFLSIDWGYFINDPITGIVAIKHDNGKITVIDTISIKNGNPDKIIDVLTKTYNPDILLEYEKDTKAKRLAKSFFEK